MITTKRYHSGQCFFILASALSIVGCATNRAPQITPQPQTTAAAIAEPEKTISSPTASTNTRPPKPAKRITPSLSVQGRLRDPRLGEVSGLAVSNVDSNRLWAINDSGNLPEVYALTKQATFNQVWPVAATNRDWEALASTTIGGLPYLLVADTGDNLTAHEESRLHLIEEPDETTDKNKTLVPVNTIRFSYPDGPHNVEAMAVSGQDIYLLTKERLNQRKIVPSRIYRLTLKRNERNSVQTASFQGTVTMPKRSWKTRLLTKVLKFDPLQPTDLVISSDDTHAYVLNYLHVLHYERSVGDSWPDAFSKPPRVVHHHGLRQAEALTISPDGDVWLTSENVGAQLLAFTSAQSSNASLVSP